MPRAPRVRVDALVVERGLARSRSEAARLVMAGRVRLGPALADKAGRLVPADARVEMVAAAPYVGRGGEKLAGALAALGVTPAGRVCLDVGASTGGFTDCLLQAGARRVYAVDVGRGQLHPRLAADPRVVVMDQVNARSLAPGSLPEPPTLATIDVSFISLAKVLPAVASCLLVEVPRSPAEVGNGRPLSESPREIVALVKPQFEVGRGLVGKGGVVRDRDRHREVLARLVGLVPALGLSACGVTASPLRGPKGNREFFLHLVAGRAGACPGALEAAIAAVVAG